MHPLPTLDAHAHLEPNRSSQELAEVGSVLGMTLSLSEAEVVLGKDEPYVAWGVGCHPRKLAAQQAFKAEHFSRLAVKTAVIGEVGLDSGSRVPFELQQDTFRTVLAYASQNPRIVSIHSFRSTTQVLDELSQQPIVAPILHWWTGSAAETRRAVDLGCYFSVHSAVARRSLFRTQVPLERLLVESDQGWIDPPAAIPHRIALVEYLLSASLKMDVGELRRLVWLNFNEVVRQTGTRDMLPVGLKKLLS
jgi:TatD DNase family protein